jgi:hypothetical protein
MRSSGSASFSSASASRRDRENEPADARKERWSICCTTCSATPDLTSIRRVHGGLQYDEGVQLVDRLKRFAAARGRSFGCKFSNTLEVLNHRQFFTPDNKVQYLSGQPLHVITMTLTDVFRKDIGADIPISFSAGIDNKNFPQAVACGFVPATVCTDLLRRWVWSSAGV